MLAHCFHLRAHFCVGAAGLDYHTARGRRAAVECKPTGTNTREYCGARARFACPSALEPVFPYLGFSDGVKRGMFGGADVAARARA